MATINSLLSSGYSASSSKGTTDAKSEINNIKEKMSKLDKDTGLTSAERAEQKKKYSEELKTLKSELSDQTSANMENAAASAVNLANTMFGNNQALNGATSVENSSFFFGAGASMSSLKAINTARINIENRARTLTSEIAMDKLRGIDTSGKREMLTNLTSNLQIMDDNLNKNIEGALDDSSDSKTPEKSVIDKIKEDLAANQAKLKEEFDTKKSTDDKTTEKS